MYNNYQQPGMYQGQYQQPFMGAGYNQYPYYANRVKPTQPLTPDEAKLLKKMNGNQFTLTLSEEDLLKCKCTHKDPQTGDFSLYKVVDNNGVEKMRCGICGEEFEMVNYSVEDVKYLVSGIIDCFQTVKTVQLDAPEAIPTEYMKIIPLLKKFPKLYEIALSFMDRQGIINGGNRREASGFQQLNNIFNPNMPLYGNGYNPNGYMGYNPYYGAPMMNDQFGGMYQQPMYNQMYNQPPMQQPYQPQMNGYQQQNANPFYDNQMQQPLFNQPQMNMQQPTNQQYQQPTQNQYQQQYQPQQQSTQQVPPQQPITGPDLKEVNVSNVMGV